MWKFLELLGYLGIMLATVPLVGLLTFGSRKEAIRYTKAWAKGVGWLIAAAGVIGLVLYPFIN